LPTLRDIVDALLRPGRDPREDVPPPVFRQDVLSLEDIKTGMEFEGVVRNVVDFGAFVDIGVKIDGLVHISEISNRRIKHPLEVVSIGDIIKVRVLSVDPLKKRISLSMKTDLPGGSVDPISG
ncbi:MAG TPA: S1 RNA-binding domain-containing protein, partial [Syntrophomonadaceae bacterium]|nr:S1 RNA-binding domain-containing protein [Syntrophomonadaceae bacterium]